MQLTARGKLKLNISALFHSIQSWRSLFLFHLPRRWSKLAAWYRHRTRAQQECTREISAKCCASSGWATLMNPANFSEHREFDSTTVSTRSSDARSWSGCSRKDACCSFLQRIIHPRVFDLISGQGIRRKWLLSTRRRGRWRLLRVSVPQKFKIHKYIRLEVLF